MSGTLGKITPIAATNTLLYSTPTGKTATVALNACNTNSSIATINAYILKAADLAISSVTTVNAGSGWTSIPTITLTGTLAGATTQSGAISVTNMNLAQATIVSGGTGYAVGDTITVNGGTGTSATISVTAVASGVITAISVLTGGAYTALPTGTLTTTKITGSGTGLTLSATSFGIGAVAVTTPGIGYTSTPSYAFSGTGVGAQLTLNMTTAACQITDAIMYQFPLSSSGTVSNIVERTNLCVSGGDSLFVQSSIAGVNFLAYGAESIF